MLKQIIYTQVKKSRQHSTKQSLFFPSKKILANIFKNKLMKKKGYYLVVVTGASSFALLKLITVSLFLLLLVAPRGCLC